MENKKIEILNVVVRVDNTWEFNIESENGEWGIEWNSESVKSEDLEAMNRALRLIKELLA